jgi:hypothetical protein
MLLLIVDRYFDIFVKIVMIDKLWDAIRTPQDIEKAKTYIVQNYEVA